MSGWIRVEREIFKHDFFATDVMSEREAWVWMVAQAAWKDTRHRVGSVMCDVPRGSFFCTLRELQNAWGWGSDKRVRTFLKRTQAERMVVLRTDAKKTHVTICNYEKYQARERTEDATGTQAGSQDGRNGDALKEQVNNKQLTNIIKKPSKKASQFPELWMPSEKAIGFCISKQYDETQIGQMVEDCINHHRGKGNTFKDHDAAFRTWASNQIKFHGTPDIQRRKANGQSNNSSTNTSMGSDPTLDAIANAATAF